MSSDLTRALSAYTSAHSGANPYVTAIDGLTILRSDHPKPPMPLLHEAAICYVVQGAKRGIFGEKQLEYRSGQALVVGVETPTQGWVSKATPDEPFLGMLVRFDVAMVREIFAEIGGTASTIEEGGVFVADVGPEIEACALRLVKLLQRPDAIGVVAPLIRRELTYWLLTSPYGPKIAAMVADSNPHGVVAAIHELRTRFAEPIRIDELASTANMSASAFHRRFKMITAMTPLQYQKQMRLLEARHLMIADEVNAETAAFRVGYESQSQFSREYARMFGAPPRRDVNALRFRAASGAD